MSMELTDKSAAAFSRMDSKYRMKSSSNQKIGVTVEGQVVDLVQSRDGNQEANSKRARFIQPLEREKLLNTFLRRQRATFRATFLHYTEQVPGPLRHDKIVPHFGN